MSLPPSGVHLPLQEAGWGGTAMAAAAGLAIGGIKGAAIGALARMGLAALMPDAVGTPRELAGKGKNTMTLHGMDQFLIAKLSHSTQFPHVLMDK